MVIKGNARGGAAQLAKHLQRLDTNEQMNVVELRGVMAADLDSALAEMEAVASGTRSQRPLYHASINTRADEPLTVEQRTHAIDQLEAALGLSGQARAVVAHEKEGRAHVHIVWSRIDLERMTAISDSFNYRCHEECARELEREFGHARVQGAHAEREGQERPARTPSHGEMQQAERTGLTPQAMKAQITELWRATDSGQAFVAALDDAGLVLAQGDKRDFVIVDQAAEVHSLARRIEGAKAKDVRERMSDIDPSQLPNVEQAKAIQQERGLQAAPASPEPAVPPSAAAAPAMPERLPDSAYANDGRGEQLPMPETLPPAAPEPSREPSPEAAAIAWEDRLAEASIAKAKWEEKSQQLMSEPHRPGLRISEGLVERDLKFHEAQAARAAAAEERAEKAAAFEYRQELRELNHAADQIERTVTQGVDTAADGALRVGGMAAKGAGRAADRLVDVVDGFLDLVAGVPPPRTISAAEYASSPVARREHHQQQAMQATAALDRGQALDTMRDDIAAGRNLDANSIKKLNQDDLENIKAKGDDHLRTLIRNREEERSRDYSSGRQREHDKGRDWRER